MLRATFTGSHQISSGAVGLSISLSPSGSSVLSGPISLSFGGPFQSRGAGELPESDFTASVSALGQSGSLGIISTGTTGYVTLSGTGYQLPQASFRQLEAGFSGLGGSGSSSGTGASSTLGLHPLSWLRNPTVIGTESVAGAQTTQIHADVNVRTFLESLSPLLSRASGVGVKGVGKLPTSISPATAAKLAAEIRNPSVDVWTGTSDKTLRKLELALTVPLSGKTSRELGGVSSVGVRLTLQYSDLGQPQTVSAPTHLAPYKDLTAKLNAIVSEVQGAVVLGSLGSAGSSSGASGSGTTGNAGSSSSSSSSSSTRALSRYSQCIQAAGKDVAKMQKCASLLGSG
jgi:hypothetical protein